MEIILKFKEVKKKNNNHFVCLERRLDRNSGRGEYRKNDGIIGRPSLDRSVGRGRVVVVHNARRRNGHLPGNEAGQRMVVEHNNIPSVS